MTYSEVFTMLQEVGVPVAYYQFPDDTPQELPFICFIYPNRNDSLADNSNYKKIEHLVIELYTDNKDIVLEKALESVLEDHGLVYTRDEEHLDDERMFEEVYETDVIISEEITNNGEN